MSVLDDREFYELCQTYRHTPRHEFAAVSANFGALCEYVDKLINESCKNQVGAMTTKKEKENDIYQIKLHGETLKEMIWGFMDRFKCEHPGLKSSMNETLDLIDELDLGDE